MGGFTAQEFHFGEFILDHSRYRLQRGARLLRLEKLPMELLILLVQRRGELVSREEIAERLWRKDVFVDVDHSINTAIRKIRIVLRDDPEKPRFIETVVGKGYRFALPVTCNGDCNPEVQPLPSPVQVGLAPAVLSSDKKAVSVRLRLLTGTVSILALVIVGFVLNRGGVAKGAGQPTIKSLAVLPLKNLSGDPGQQYFVDGLTDALTADLAKLGLCG